MDDGTCLMCGHERDGRSKKFCTTCLPPHTEATKVEYNRRYNYLYACCGLHPAWGFPSSRWPKRPDVERGVCHRCAGTASSRTAKYCDTCRSDLRSERLSERHVLLAMNRPAGWKPRDAELRRQRMRRRKAAKRRSGTKPTVAKLAARDGWRCHLCGGPVDPALTGTKSRHKPSVDHLIPLSEDGDDEMYNCRLAHLSCNSTRGAGGTTQLLLIG